MLGLTRWALLVLLVLAAMLAVGAGAHSLWLRYNPFWDRSAEYTEVIALAATIHQRPLTDTEFARALALCEAGPFKSRSGGVSVVEEALKQNPNRGAQAVDALTRVSQAYDAELASDAARALRRIKKPMEAK